MLTLLFATAGALVALRLFLWRAILCVAPLSLRIEEDEPPGREKLPEALAELRRALEGTGFRTLGSHLERPVLGPATTCFDFANDESRTFATLFVDRDGGPNCYFLSRLAPEGFVIGADHRRPARIEPGRYLSGGLENVPVDRVYKAHLRLIEGLALDLRMDPAARLEAARAWLEGPGRKEIRQQNLSGLLWTLGTLGMVLGLVLR